MALLFGTPSTSDGGQDVFPLKAWVVAQNLGDLDAGGQLLQNNLNGDPSIPDDWLSQHHLRVRGHSLEEVLSHGALLSARYTIHFVGTHCRLEAVSKRISTAPNVHFGKPCVTGTRIPVVNVLELVEAGKSFQEITEDIYPDLTEDDIRACIRYAIELAETEEVHN